MLTCGTTKEKCRLVLQDALSSGRDSNRAYPPSTCFYKYLCTTDHDVCKKCPTCQIAKTTNQKYGKLPHKQAETNPWYTLCVDLIGPYMIPLKGKNLFKLWCLTMIDPAIGWLEMAQIPNKMVAEIADITEKTWFTRYPLPC